MKILFTLCARSGSKGYKNKNFRNFLDYPLYLYSLSLIDLFIKKHPELTVEIIINSDSLDFKEILSKTIQMKYFFIDRPKTLSGDKVAKLDVIKHSYLNAKEKDDIYDFVIDLDITSPLRRIDDLDNVYSKISNTDAELVYTVVESRRSPYFNMVQKNKEFYGRVISTRFDTRQSVPLTYDMNASIYAYKSSSLIIRDHIIEFNSDVVNMEDNYVLDIDSERDFKFMEIVASHLFSHDSDYNLIRENIKKILKSE